MFSRKQNFFHNLLNIFTFILSHYKVTTILKYYVKIYMTVIIFWFLSTGITNFSNYILKHKKTIIPDIKITTELSVYIDRPYS
jgi:hypothetical protein